MARKTQAGKRSQDRKAKRRAKARRSRQRVLWFRRLAAIVGVGLTLSILLAGTLVCLSLLKSTPEQLSGRLTGVRNITFTESTQKEGGGISPVCGCFAPPVRSWRGITFASREVTIHRGGRSKWTEWAISGAEPDQMYLYGGYKRLSVQAFRIRPDGRFNPRWLLGPNLAHHGTVLMQRRFTAYRFSLLNHGTLKLGLENSVPVGAWIPFPLSRVQLTAHESEFPGQQPRTPYIRERYASHIGVDSHQNATEPQAYPIADFLGPDLVLWSYDPDTTAPGTPIEKSTGRGVVTALLIRRSTFSTRIGVIPMSAHEVSGREELNAEHPRRAKENFFYGRYDGGRITVALNRPLKTASYTQMRRRVNKHPFTSIKTVQPFGTGKHGEPKAEKVFESERYPPLPRQSGFNVFGPLHRLFLHGVRGNVLVADRPIDMAGSADLELNDVEGLFNGNDQELLAAPLATSGEETTLQFRAVSEAKVNGVSETTGWQMHREEILLVAAVAGIIGSLVGILTFVKGFGGVGNRGNQRSYEATTAQEDI